MGAMTSAHARCFWSWPLGPKWVKTVRNDATFLVCKKCGKEADGPLLGGGSSLGSGG